MKVGDLLVTFDIPAIKKEGYPVTTPVIISNTADYTEIKKVASGAVEKGDALILLTK